MPKRRKQLQMISERNYATKLTLSKTADQLRSPLSWHWEQQADVAHSQLTRFVFEATQGLRVLSLGGCPHRPVGQEQWPARAQIRNIRLEALNGPAAEGAPPAPGGSLVAVLQP